MKKILQGTAFVLLAAMCMGGVFVGARYLAAGNSEWKNGNTVLFPTENETDDDDLLFDFTTYEDLYVKNGLIYKWDAFDMKAGGAVSTVLLNSIEGSPSVITFANDETSDHKAAEGALLSKGTLQLGSLLPFHTVKDGDADVKVLDDVTVELTLFQQDFRVDNGTNYNKASLVLPNWEADFQMRNSSAGYPIPGYGFITGVEWWGVPRDDSIPVIRNSTDSCHSVRSQIKFLGNDPLETYQIAFCFDYTVAENAYTGILDLDFFRDGQIAHSPINTSETASYDLVYNAKYMNDKTGTQIEVDSNSYPKMHISAPFGYRAIRVYNRTLTEEEMAQNHFADLAKYYKINLSTYMELTSQNRVFLHQRYLAETFETTSAKEINRVMSALLLSQEK